VTTRHVDDPFTVDHHLEQRIQLALSILGHAQPTDDRTRKTIERAVLALHGASIEQIQRDVP